MNEIEKMISHFLTKDPSHPVRVEIFGDLSEETTRRINETVMKPGTEIDLSGENKPQTVTIPLESYAQMLRSHAQMEMLRAAWDGGQNSINAVWMLRAVFGWEKDRDNNAE